MDEKRQGLATLLKMNCPKLAKVTPCQGLATTIQNGLGALEGARILPLKPYCWKYEDFISV
jgi:hypothetical protein